MAKGEIFHYLASDDMLHEYACSEIVHQFKKVKEDVGLIYCQWDDQFERLNTEKNELECIDKGYLWKDVLRSKVDLLGPVCFFRTQALRSVRGFKDGLALEDYYVLLKLTYSYKTCFYDKKLVFHRMHESNTGSYYRKIGPAAVETVQIFFKETNIEDKKLYKESMLRLYCWLSWTAFHNKDRTFALKHFWKAFWCSPKALLGDIHFFKAFIRTLFNIFKS